MALEENKGIKIVEGKTYFNMTRAAHEMKYSPMGWRKLRDALIEEGKIVLWKFDNDPKSVYILEEDMRDLGKPEKITSLDQLKKIEEAPASSEINGYQTA